ncbi:MAG: NAD(P)H-hydrate dehydratase [Gammaproteobacteria bacterium]|nr:NAD(P)H-hydrate dehydratase [Gammaproteobacteria bacterium]
MPSVLTTLPRALYRASEVSQLDRVAIDHYDIDGFTLMQRAGLVCFQVLTERWPDTTQLLVFAGAGNNGGDAWIVAGLAKEHGLAVQLVTASNPQNLHGDARTAWQWAISRQVYTIAVDDFLASNFTNSRQIVLIDGLLGTGLDRLVGGVYRQAIEFINMSKLPVLAIDIPSGLDADTGIPKGIAVKATLTASFIGMKQGLLTGMAGNYTGQLLFSDLDVPPEVYSHCSAPQPSSARIDIMDATAYLEPRNKAAHKGDHGHVTVVGGDLGYGGAVLMAAESALRTGAGLVSVLTRSCHRSAILARCPELMVNCTDDKGLDTKALMARSTVIIVGPGLGTGEWSRSLFQHCLSVQLQHNIPLIIDADGLNLLAECAPENAESIEGFKRDNWILTPHPGEAARLLQLSSSHIVEDRFAAISALQQKWGGHCLLKGHGSLIVNHNSEGMVLVCSEGNPGMATGGMGDVLAGLIAGLVAQGLDLGKALTAAVCIHGEAADLAAQEGERGLIATDLFPYLKQLLNVSR